MKRIAWLIVLVLAVIAVREGRNRFGGGSDSGPGSRSHLKAAAENANRQLPRMVDSETEMVRVDAGNGYLVYRYRLVNYDQGTLEPMQLDMLKAAVKRQTCASQSTRQNFLDHGVSIRYTYVDRNDRSMLTFIIRSGDCA